MPSLEEKENPDVESESGSSVKEIPATESKQVLPTLVRRPSLGQEASLVSNQSDTTLEFHDAPEDFMATQANSSVDREVTVRLPDTSEECEAPVEDITTAELPSITLPEEDLKIPLESDTEEDPSHGKTPSDAQEAQSSSGKFEVHVDIERDRVREVTEEQIEETSEAQVLKPDVVQEPSLESLAEIYKHQEIQELAEDSQNTSSIFVEALSFPPTIEPVNKSMEDNSAYDTIDEPAVTKVSETVPEQLVCEASVSEILVVELVNHEQMTSEPEMNEECKEESMETSGAFVFWHSITFKSFGSLRVFLLESFYVAFSCIKLLNWSDRKCYKNLYFK